MLLTGNEEELTCRSIEKPLAEKKHSRTFI
jgi:hypothetical protein